MDPLLELSLVDWSFSFMCCWNLTYGEAAVRPTYALPSTKFTMAYMETYPGLIGRFLPDLLLLSKVEKSYQLSAWNMLQEEYKLYRHFFPPIVPNFPYPLQFLVTDCTTCFDRSYAARMIPDGLKASHFNILINIRISRCLGMLPTCFGTLAILLEVWTKQYQLPRYNYLCENFQQKTYSTGVYVYYLGCVTTVPQVEFPASSYRKLAGSASREEWSIGPVPFPLNVNHDDPWISDIERG